MLTAIGGTLTVDAEKLGGFRLGHGANLAAHRTSSGPDGTCWNELDIWVDVDGSWRWKDEDDLEAAVRHGAFSQEQAANFRTEGERVIAESPFPTGWESWQPDPSWFQARTHAEKSTP
jgi:hypothetical protein